MSSALELLEQATCTAQEEMRLLREGDLDGAAELARRREFLVAESWRLRDESVEKRMLEALQRLQDLHQGIVGEARRQREDVRQELQQLQGKRKRSVAYGSQRRHPGAGMPRFVNRMG
ncbi:hypothetical protein SAMN02745704_01740 [Paucidesulfovibrio gracilis DSM 16080]|uniref:Flagellar protein FliT n=1 Tax=Paucidesulfovibrio gracilis DSM 16080 TaxID=1121449 RepID=A0A1T4X5D1_9BACT|nr:hypothetical protein [Paucidesulfovibrio gracilis]SKA84265.1 hypothetical protein SAMN02745704_01740 [Paucidesulfovibrio gracilis DSM 16080]